MKLISIVLRWFLNLILLGERVHKITTNDLPHIQAAIDEQKGYCKATSSTIKEELQQLRK